MTNSRTTMQKLMWLIVTLCCLTLAQACGLNTEWKVGMRGKASITDSNGAASVELTGGRTAETWDEADLTLDHQLDFNIRTLTGDGAQTYQLSLTLDGPISRVGEHKLTTFEGYIDIPGNLYRSREIVRITDKDWTATARIVTTSYDDDPDSSGEMDLVQQVNGTLELTLQGPDNLRLAVKGGTFKVQVQEVHCVDECRGL